MRNSEARGTCAVQVTRHCIAMAMHCSEELHTQIARLCDAPIPSVLNSVLSMNRVGDIGKSNQPGTKTRHRSSTSTHAYTCSQMITHMGTVITTQNLESCAAPRCNVVGHAWKLRTRRRSRRRDLLLPTPVHARCVNAGVTRSMM